MANTARVTQSVLEAGTILANGGVARVTQSVIEALVGLGVDCNSPPGGQVGVAYTHTFLAGGGFPPITFSITGGSLPNGIAMVGATGVASGTPTVSGLFQFDLTATDSTGDTATVQCSINIAQTQQVANVGSPYPMNRCQKPNFYDACLLELEAMQRRIKFPPLCAIPKEFCNLLPWDVDYNAGAVPHEAVPFRKMQGIVTPAPAAGNQVVVTWRVENGYDGILTGLYFGYSGLNFEQGSGDIIWRVQINRRYVKDLSNVPFLLGAPTTPVPLTEGQILFSGQQVSAVVEVPNLSGQIQVGASTVYAGLIGFLWPR